MYAFQFPALIIMSASVGGRKENHHFECYCWDRCYQIEELKVIQIDGVLYNVVHTTAKQVSSHRRWGENGCETEKKNNK